jgi:glycosyltransferase involved in cell wall biosynthesis
VHILHVIDSLALGGAERMLVDIANATVADGHRVSVCITRSENHLGVELNSQIQVLVLNRQKRFDWGAIQRFKAFVQHENVDVLHTHSRTTFSFVALMKSLRQIRLPIVMHDHYGGIEIDFSVPRWFQRWGKYLVSHYVGVYERLGEWGSAAGIPADKISVIGNALNLERLRCERGVNLHERFSIAQDIKIGVVVAGIRPEKGIDLLIESVAKSKQRDRFKILIIGGANHLVYAEQCSQNIKRLGLEDIVVFIGKHHQVPELIKHADFALLPSRSESGPLVIIEYLAAGLPIVAFQVGNISKRAVEQGVEGFVPPQDTDAFAHMLDQLLMLSEDQMQKRSLQGLSVAENQFDIRTKMKAWYRVYNKVLKREVDVE